MRMSELLNEVNKFELDEGFSPKEIKMAIGIASDPRYKGGNMTGAVNAIDKVKKGLSDHPKVAAVLRRQNEEVEEAVSPAQQAAIAISKKEKTKKEALDKDDEKTVGDVIKGLKKAVKAHQGQVKNLTKDIQDQVELDELTSEEKKLLDKMFDKKGNLTPLGKKVMDQGKKEEVEENTLDIGNESDYTLDEGKMKDLHGYISSGKSAEEIAKIMKIDAGTVKTLMNDFKKEGFSSDAQRKAAFASGYKEKDKKDKKEDVKVIEGYFPEQKSSTGYDLYHKDFSGAMQHAYAHAKKKLGITIDNDEIDDKVASGPRKPSKGKTNSYRLKGDKGSVQIQVYNMGSKFELNMYKESVDEEVEIDEGKNKPVSQMTPKEKAADAARRKEYKSFQKSKRGEEVEIDEKAPKIGVDRLKLQRDKDKSHADAMGRHVKSGRKKSVKEEVEIDEAISGDQYYYVDPKGVVAAVGNKDAMRKMNMKQAKDGNKGGSFSQNLKKYKVGDKIKEEVEIDESVKLGGMPAGLSKERIKADRDVYAQVLGIKEALDPADFDISATSKDKDNATKNIILQLRKVLSLNGKNPVEFSSGKKEKVHPNVAAAALTKFEKLRRTDQKDEFQQKIAKSYKDLLNAVKGK